MSLCNNLFRDTAFLQRNLNEQAFAWFTAGKQGMGRLDRICQVVASSSKHFNGFAKQTTDAVNNDNKTNQNG